MSEFTLDEAIKHCLEIASEKEECAKYRPRMDYYDEIPSAEECYQCASEYRQIAKWLTEFKEAKRLLKSATSIIKDVDCNEDYLCDECEYRAKCDGGFSFYWRYADEALKLMGDEDNEH